MTDAGVRIEIGDVEVQEAEARTRARVASSSQSSMTWALRSWVITSGQAKELAPSAEVTATCLAAAGVPGWLTWLLGMLGGSLGEWWQLFVVERAGSQETDRSAGNVSARQYATE